MVVDLLYLMKPTLTCRFTTNRTLHQRIPPRPAW